MINGLRVVAIIPARGGSKGLPSKNIKPLLGKPLIAWSIEQAKQSKYLDKVMVIVDDPEIAEISRKYGADVPFLNLPELTMENSTTTGSVLYALEGLEKRGDFFDIIVTLEPVKCIRDSEDIDKCIEKVALNNNVKALVSLIPIEKTTHPDWAVKIDEHGFVEGKKRGDLFRRQDLDKRYGYSGYILAAKVSDLKKEGTFYTDKTWGFVLDKKEKTVDIDTEVDFIIAETLMKRKIEEKKQRSDGLGTKGVGIMQGRLSPRVNGRYQAFPKENWKNEFKIAKELGFDCIEFILDYEEFQKNPLLTKEGIGEINQLIKDTGIGVYSICADYFMRYWLHDGNEEKRRENVQILIELIKNSSLIGVKDITLPFVDESSLKTKDDFLNLKRSLKEALPYAKQYGINLNLETDLPPKIFGNLLRELNHPNLKINYDSGNSASWGYNIKEEFGGYGDYISVIHIKDRFFRGGSVKLGGGDVDFKMLIDKIKEFGLSGPIIMQAARAEKSEDELAFVKEQFNFLKEKLGGKLNGLKS